MFESRATLGKAAEEMFGQAALPFFDMANADVVFSFGANFLETWLSPVAYTRGFSKMRKGTNGKRGTLIQFEARMSQTGAVADEWIPLRPGTEGLVAAALGRLVAEARGVTAGAFAQVDAAKAAESAGIPLKQLEHLAGLFANAERPLALVGGAALAQNNGLQVAKSVLALNASMNNLGQPGGVFLSPLAPGVDKYHRPASAQEMDEFVKKLAFGRSKSFVCAWSQSRL